MLLDDMTEEMARTRQLRGELDLGQSVINALEDAIIVFAPSGLRLSSNKAFETLWGLGPETLPRSVIDACRLWQQKTRPNLVWGDIRDAVGRLGERAEWSDQVELTEGGPVDCRVMPLPGGATLVAFCSAGPLPVFRPQRTLQAAIA